MKNQHKNSYYKTILLKMSILPAFLMLAVLAANPADLQAQDADGVYTVVDEMPEINGGLSALYSEIKYPREAVRAGVEGRVFLQFIVDEEGNVIDPVVLRDIGAGCGEAATEAIQNVKFSPGKQNGTPVKVKFSLPVSFEIRD